MKYYIISILLVFFISFVSADMSSDIVISLDTAVELALKNSAELKNLSLDLNDNTRHMVTSWNVFIPDVSMSFEFSRNNERETIKRIELTPAGPIMGDAYGVIPEEKVTTPPEWTAGFLFDLSLELHARQGFSIYRTILAYRQSKLELEQGKKAVEKAVKEAFYSLVFLEKKRALFKDALQEAFLLYEQAQEDYEAGKISQYDLLSAQTGYISLEPALQEINRVYNDQMTIFKTILGINRTQTISLASPVFPEPEELTADDIKTLPGTRIDIRAMKAAYTISRCDMHIKLTALTPSFMIGFSIDETFTQDPFTTAWFGDSEYMNDNWKQNRGAFRLGITVPVSALFPFSPEQSELLDARTKYKQQANTIEKLEKDALHELENMINQAWAARRMIEKMSENLTILQQEARLVADLYNSGIKELADVERVRMKLLQMELFLLQEELRYQCTLIKLDYLYPAEIRRNR